MRGVIKRGVITLPVTNRTAAAHLKSVVLRRCDSNAFTECGCERLSVWLLSQCGGCHIGACRCASCCCCGFNSSSRSSSRGSRRYRRSRRRRRSLFGSKERGDRSRLHCCGRSSCRRVLAAAFCSPHVHVVGGLHTACFPAHRGHVLCVIPRQMLYHPGDRRRCPVNVCGVTSGGCYLM